MCLVWKQSERTRAGLRPHGWPWSVVITVKGGPELLLLPCCRLWLLCHPDPNFLYIGPSLSRKRGTPVPVLPGQLFFYCREAGPHLWSRVRLRAGA